MSKAGWEARAVDEIIDEELKSELAASNEINDSTTDEYNEVTLETMAGHCPNCERDFSMWLIGLETDDGEIIDQFYRCSHCGYRE